MGNRNYLKLRDLTAYYEDACAQERQTPDELLNIIEIEQSTALWKHALSHYMKPWGEIPRYSMKFGDTARVWRKRGKCIITVQEVDELLVPINDYDHKVELKMADFPTPNKTPEQTTASLARRAVRGLYRKIDNDIMTMLQVVADQQSCVRSENFAGMIVDGYNKMVATRDVGSIVVSPRCIEILADLLGNNREGREYKGLTMKMHPLTGKPEIAYRDVPLVPTKMLPNSMALVVAKEAAWTMIHQSTKLIPVQNQSRGKLGMVATMAAGICFFDEKSVLRSTW